MDEVYDNIRNHFDDKDEKIWFLEELIFELKDELEDINTKTFTMKKPKTRTMNELRQTKEYQGVGTSAADTETISADGVPLGTRRGWSEIDIETTKDLIFNSLKNKFYDMIFQAVNDEMAKHEVFQAETYFTP